MTEEKAKYILKKNKDDYEKIAIHFSHTRSRPWEEMHEWVKFASDGGKVLDIGCGNGRLFPLLNKNKTTYQGVDISEKLIDISKKTYKDGNFRLGSILEMPFPDNSFDYVFCIAVLHHIPSKKLQEKALKEISRVLKPGGTLILTTWNLLQLKYIKYIFSSLLLKLVKWNEIDVLDCYIPWKDQERKVIVKRYCHAFTLSKIRKITKKSDLQVTNLNYTKNGKLTNFLQGKNVLLTAKKKHN